MILRFQMTDLAKSLLLSKFDNNGPNVEHVCNGMLCLGSE